jgi:hypothetical protein
MMIWSGKSREVPKKNNERIFLSKRAEIYSARFFLKLFISFNIILPYLYLSCVLSLP